MIDHFREHVETALEQGATKADIARAIGVPPSTLSAALERWGRPERVSPAHEALEALRRLAEGD